MPTRSIYLRIINCLLLGLALLLGSSTDAATVVRNYSYAYVQLDTPEIDTNWRYTRFGWQNSTEWRLTSEETTPRGIERISPVLLSLDIILAVAAAMIWASDERQVATLFGRDIPEADSIKQ